MKQTPPRIKTPKPTLEVSHLLVSPGQAKTFEGDAAIPPFVRHYAAERVPAGTD